MFPLLVLACCLIFEVFPIIIFTRHSSVIVSKQSIRVKTFLTCHLPRTYSYSESQNMNASNFFHLFFVALSQILLECFTKRIHTDYWLVNMNLNIKSCKSVRYSLRWASLTWTNYVQLCLVSMMFQLLSHRSHQASLFVTLSGLFTSLSFDNANIMAANIFRENLVLRILMPKIIRISYSYVKFMIQLFSLLFLVN